MSKTVPLIAIVDDEESVCRSMDRLMRSVGLDVVTFTCGTQFLLFLETRRPACLVLDLHMPRMSGFEVQSRLTRAGSGLPVVVITGHDSPQSRQRVLDAGAIAYLRKPVDDRTLLNAVGSVIPGLALE